MINHVLMKVVLKKKGFSELKEISRNVDNAIKSLTNNGMYKDLASRYVQESIDDAYVAVCKQLLEEYVGVEVNDVRYKHLFNNVVGTYKGFYNQVLLSEKYSLMNLVRSGDKATFVASVDTMLHEFRHAWQEVNMPEIKDGYVNSEVDFKAYYNHPAEKDARRYAKKNTKAFIKIMEANIDTFIESINNKISIWIDDVECSTQRWA